jgi:3-hydroxybutyryl-CoA dehydratase
MDELHGYYLEDLTTGMSASYARTLTETEIILFAGISGDDNPVHVNAEYAATTAFKGRIAHGVLTAALISTVLGTKLPGPGTIFLGLNIRFKAPVRAGDTVTATATVREIVQEKRRVVLDVACSVVGNPVVEGEATVMVDRRPAAG